MSRRCSVMICGGLTLLTLAVFAQTRQHEFLNFDDFTYITINPHVRSGLSTENAIWAFTTGYDGNWIPLTWLSLMLDAEWHGDHAGGYHLTNLVLHLANVLLLFVILRRMTSEPWKSAFVAALFAVHPLHVESVAWITERKDTLSTFFGFLAIGAYARYCERRAIVLFAFAVIAFLCSLMSKQTLVTLPLLLLLLDFWPLRRIRRTISNGQSSWHTAEGVIDSESSESPVRASRPQKLNRLLVEKIPFLVLTVIFCLIAYFVQRDGGAMQLSAELSFPARFANATVVYVLYLQQTIWPTNLSAFYPYPDGSIPATHVAGAAVLLSLLTVLAFRIANRHPYFMVGWLWYLVSLLPMIGLVQIGLQRMADRYTYIPLVGIFVAITWLVPTMVPRGLCRTYLLPIFAIVVLTICTLLSWHQVKVWRNSIALFKHALSVTDDNFFMHRSLGNALLDQGQGLEAINHYRSALQIRQDYAEAHDALGHVLIDHCHVDEGVHHLRQAQQHFERRSRMQSRKSAASGQFQQTYIRRMDLALSQYWQGESLEDVGEVEQAIEYYERSLRIAPESAMAADEIRKSHHKPNYSRTAIELYEQQVADRPNDMTAHINLGVALWSRNRLDDAIQQLQIAFDIDPRNDDARQNLASGHVAMGVKLVQRRKLDAAIALFRRALALLPNDGYTHLWLAEIFLMQELFPLAERDYVEALRLGETSAELHFGLGVALLRQKKREAAKKHLKEAARLNPNSPQAEWIRWQLRDE